MVVLDTSSQETPTEKTEAEFPESKKTTVIEPSVRYRFPKPEQFVVKSPNHQVG